MKNNLLRSSLALLALCSAASLSAASIPAAGEIILPRVAAVVPANGDTVSPGTSRIMVSLRLGTPTSVLADGSWLYAGYNVSRNADARSNPARSWCASPPTASPPFRSRTKQQSSPCARPRSTALPTKFSPPTIGGEWC